MVAYEGEWHGISVTESDKDIIPYKVYIPSFSGESTFILMKPSNNKITFDKVKSHLNMDVWNSYTIFNY